MISIMWWPEDFTHIVKDDFPNAGEETVVNISTGLVLDLHPANEKRRYKVTPSLGPLQVILSHKCQKNDSITITNKAQ